MSSSLLVVLPVAAMILFSRYRPVPVCGAEQSSGDLVQTEQQFISQGKLRSWDGCWRDQATAVHLAPL